MRRRPVIYALILSYALASFPGPAAAGGFPFPWKPKPGEPVSLEHVVKEIDCIEDKVRDDGIIVMKHPDVYGQSRMTLYRKNFEQQLYGAINNFNLVLAGRVVRSDQQGFLSQSNLTSVLAATAAGRNGGRSTTAAPSSANTVAVVTPGGSSGSGSGSGTPASAGVVPDAFAPGTINRSAPFAQLPGGHPFSGPFATQNTPYGLGVEPTVYLDQLADYQNHLNQLRRINMGDDIADSAGYGLYQIRMPVSIQPGECTYKGHGAILTATVYHDFGPEFLYTTYRNLAVNDVMDQLTPIIYEMIRSGALDTLTGIKTADDALFKYRRHKGKPTPKNDDGYKYHQFLAIFWDESAKATGTSTIMKSRLFEDIFKRAGSLYGVMTRNNDRSYPLAPTEFDDVFFDQNLVMLAIHARDGQQTATPRATDVRAFLRREIEAAYDVIQGIYDASDSGAAEVVRKFEEAVQRITQHVKYKDYVALQDDYRLLAHTLPGELKYFDTKDYTDKRSPGVVDPYDTLINPITIFCYAIAVEATLLDQQLRLDMKRVLGKNGDGVDDIDSLQFYPPRPSDEVRLRFEEYVRARWPIITFSVDPFRSEQNIADAASLRRDLQIALAFAFATGQITFNQLTQFQRRIEFDSETIALNQTVNSFALDKDTFGFRFQPRYQNPPPERSNFQSLTNQLLKGGPGRNYQLNNSKLESGQRELDVIFLMPSFLQSIKMDVTGNWFPLHDPDQMKTPTKRMIELGRRVVELREALACIHDHKHYRPGDIQRLTTRVLQLERMLPMQTHEIQVPYENTLGGFQLFQQGTTALVPQLDGFEGADGIADGQETDLVIFGKHFSVQETNVIVGGIYLSTQPLDVQQSLAAAQANVTAAQATSDAAAQSASAAPQGGSGASSKAADAAKAAAQKQASATQSSLNAAKQNMAAAQSSSSTAVGSATTLGAAPSAPGAVDVVSREVLRLKIPAGAQPTEVWDSDRKTKQSYVEIYVATPNGISNRLLVPYRPKNHATAPAATAAVGYTIDDNLKLIYSGQVAWDANGDVILPNLKFEPNGTRNPLTIKLDSGIGVVPKQVSASFKVKLPDGKQSRPITVQDLADDKGAYVLKGKDLDTLANGILNLPEFPQFLKGQNLSPNLTTTVSLTPSVLFDGLEGVAKDANNTLTVNVQVVLTNPTGSPINTLGVEAAPAATPNPPIPGPSAPAARPPSPPLPSAAPGQAGGAQAGQANPPQTPGGYNDPGFNPAPTWPKALKQEAPATPKPAPDAAREGAATHVEAGSPLPDLPPLSAPRAGPTTSRPPAAEPRRDAGVGRSAYRPALPDELPPLPALPMTRPDPSARPGSPRTVAPQADRKTARPTAPVRRGVSAPAPRSDAPDVAGEPAARPRWFWQRGL